MSKNIYDVEEVKALLNNGINSGGVEELTLGMTSELSPENKKKEQEIRETVHKIKKYSLGENSYVNRNTITAGPICSSLANVGDFSITLKGSERYEEELEILKDAIEEFGALNLQITDLHVDYIVLPKEPKNTEGILEVLDTPLENGIVNKFDIAVLYRKNMDKITDKAKERYKKHHNKYNNKKEEHFFDNHFAIFEGIHT